MRRVLIGIGLAGIFPVLIGCGGTSAEKAFVEESLSDSAVRISYCDLWKSGNVSPQEVVFLFLSAEETEAELLQGREAPFFSLDKQRLEDAVLEWHESNC